jgi:hypothetical protein
MADQQSVEAAISMQKIYEKVNNLFGASTQLFSMEFPARALNPADYTYNTDNHNSVVNKPQAVAEAEFRLADDLFDISQLTAGPNGEKLSTVYKTVINNFVPKLDELADFVVDRFELNRWLMEEVEGFVDRNDKDPKKKFKGSRMAFSQKIYQLYLEKKNEWNIEKEKHRKAAEDGSAKEYEIDGQKYTNYTMDDYTKWLSTTGAVKEEELNSYYADAVVRGNYHEIQTILGYLNAASTAEALEKTKSNMRNSRRRSLDESMDVYPVQMQPSDWYKYLDTNLTADDLLNSHDTLKRKYENKQKQLASAMEHLATLKIVSVDQATIDDLEKKVKEKEKTLKTAMNQVENEIGSNLFKTINFSFNTVAKLYGSVPKLIKAYEDSNKVSSVMSAIQEHIIGNLPTGEIIGEDAIKKLLDTHKNHKDVSAQQMQLEELRSKKAMLESREYSANIAIQQTKIDALQKEVNSLEELLQEIPVAKKRAEELEDTICYELGITRVSGNKEKKEELLKTLQDNIITKLKKNPQLNTYFESIDSDSITTESPSFETIQKAFKRALEGIQNSKNILDLDNKTQTTFDDAQTTLNKLITSKNKSQALTPNHITTINDKLQTLKGMIDSGKIKSFENGDKYSDLEEYLKTLTYKKTDVLSIFNTKVKELQRFVQGKNETDTFKDDVGNLNEKLGTIKGLLKSPFKSEIPSVKDNTTIKELKEVIEKIQNLSGNKELVQHKADFTKLQREYKQAESEKVIEDVESRKKFNQAMQKQKGLLPKQVNPNEGFSDIVITVSKDDSLTEYTEEHREGHKERGSGWWFYSSVSNTTEKKDSSQFKSTKSSQEFEIAMRVMKVTINRGGWFNPTILKMSGAFYHLASLPIGSTLSASSVHTIFGKNEDPHTQIKESLTVTLPISNHLEQIPANQYYKYGDDKEGSGNTAHALLPTFPTSFVIAKDVVIRVSADSEEHDETKEKTSSITTNHSSSWWSRGKTTTDSSSSESNSSFNSSEHGSTYIRIPGPQILGWFSEFVHADQSTPYRTLEDAGVSIKQIRDKLKAHGLSPNRDVHKEAVEDKLKGEENSVEKEA